MITIILKIQTELGCLLSIILDYDVGYIFMNIQMKLYSLAKHLVEGMRLIKIF